MLAQYLHDIALGSLSTLQMMPGQPGSGVQRVGANKAASTSGWDGGDALRPGAGDGEHSQCKGELLKGF